MKMCGFFGNMEYMFRKLTTRQIQQFQKKIFDYHTEYGRHDLPWRKKSRTPYHVLVSEVMLQQTQVDRVAPFFKAWTTQFPNWKSLASAPQSEVLRAWKGLGYNSRALRLQKLAQSVVRDYASTLPRERKILESLPGIGPYTAGAVRVFAFGLPDLFIETNIRRVFIHEFFNTEIEVHDKSILKLVEQTLPESDPVQWYSGLMDYGSTLPKVLKKNSNIQSKHYTKQSTFKGSDREVRGKVLDFLLERKSLTLVQIENKLKAHTIICETKRLEKILEQLVQESFLEVRGKKYFLK